MISGLISFPLRSRAGDAAPSGELIFGPENALVHAAAAVVEGGRVERSPLLLTGPASVGKTDLAHYLADRFELLSPAAATRLVLRWTAADFARRLADALETDSTADFQDRLNRASLLVLDDVQHLAGRANAAGELAAVCDDFQRRGALLIVTASQSPGEIPDFDPRLASRLTSGLCVDITYPAASTRRELLALFAAEVECRLDDVTLSFLATQERAFAGAKGSPSALRSFIRRLQHACQTAGTPADLAATRTHLAQRMQPPTQSLRRIALAAAQTFGVTLRALRSQTRARSVVQARNAAIHLARMLLGVSYAELGRYFGGRDHTTILHASRKATELLAADPAFAESVARLSQQLAQGEVA